jgi:hypothetical protein
MSKDLDNAVRELRKRVKAKSASRTGLAEKGARLVRGTPATPLRQKPSRK